MIIRSFLITLLILHSGIHLVGFFKAFEISTINQLTKPIDKTTGLLWLIATLCFLGTAIIFQMGARDWWVFGIVSILLSQGLIL